MAEEKQIKKAEPEKEKKIVEESKKEEREKKVEIKKEGSVQKKELDFKKEIKEKPAEPKKSEEQGKEYIIPLRKRWKHVPRYKRAKKAVKSVKEFLVRHMKVRDGDLNKIKIDKYLNEAIWARGIRKPLSKVKVRVISEGGIFRAELVDMPEKLKFKKARLERREQEAEDFVDKKKADKKLEEKVQEPAAEVVSESKEEVEEKKKEESEKKASVIEAGEKRAKSAAKQAKHQTKIHKGPKRPQRKALEK